jgi:hypothetical protein
LAPELDAGLALESEVDRPAEAELDPDIEPGPSLALASSPNPTACAVDDEPQEAPTQAAIASATAQEKR